MTVYTFKSYPAAVTARFDCPQCGKKNRLRTFRAECTVNPFNKNEDGSVKTPDQVRKQSQEDAVLQERQFMGKPLCATCENGLSYRERKTIFEARRTSTQAGARIDG